MKSTLRNMVLSLGGFSALSALALGLCYNATLEPRLKAEADAANKAIEAVLPEFDNSPVVEVVNIDDCKIYPAYHGGKLVGAAIETVAHDGFSGDISLIVGFDADAALVDYAILSHAETPGLGAKVGEWFKDSLGGRSVIGTTGDLALTKDGGSVDGITAATITSRAFVNAVNHARHIYINYIAKQ